MAKKTNEEVAEKEPKEKKKLTIEDLQKGLAKKYGSNSFVSLGSRENEKYDVIETGSKSLDIATGIGGYPRGRIVEIFGAESSGKSTLSLHLIANTTNQGLKAALIDSEFSFDLTYAEALGVNKDNLYLSQPGSLEEGLNIAKDVIESGEFAVVIIDSLSSMCPQKELEGDIGDYTIGIKARLIGQLMRQITASAHKHNVLVLLIGQVRDKIGVMFGSPETTDYGNAVKFFASMRFRISKNVEKDGSVALYNKTKVQVIKNKCAAPFKTAEFLIKYGTGIDTYQEKIDMAINADIIIKKGSWSFYNDISIGQGIDGITKTFNDNPELQEEIFAKTYEYYKNL